jgi:hypothetical protein
MMRQRREYPSTIKNEIGLWLITAPRGSQKIMAQSLEISTRTLSEWKKRALQPTKKRGRKKARVSFAEIRSIKIEWKKQGCPGSRPIIKALPKISVRKIRQVITALKTKTKKRAQRHREENRTTVKVHSAGVVGAMDAATLKEHGGDFIVYRDRGAITTEADKCADANADSQDTLKTLNSLKEKNKLPLVACTDNGSPFCSEVVEDFMNKNKVIHLKSLPRVPQHNGSAENSVGDFKRTVKLGFTPIQACVALTQARRRQSLDWQTPAEVEQKTFKRYTTEERTQFYEAACSAINTAVLGTKSVYEKRKAEREAIFQTLESFSLITRTRGHPSRFVKAEEIT